MSREILFRGRKDDMSDCTWIYGSLIIEGDKYFIRTKKMKGSIGLGNEVFKKSVGQFTGLMDKNVNKIFEGDILTSTFGSGDPYCINFGSWDCDGENMIGWYTYPDNTSFGLTIEGNTDAYTVIGNIHDNPELIGRETYNG